MLKDLAVTEKLAALKRKIGPPGVFPSGKRGLGGLLSANLTLLLNGAGLPEKSQVSRGENGFIILFDNTASMLELIRELVKQIDFLVSEILEFSPRTKICLMAYKDFIEDDNFDPVEKEGFHSDSRIFKSFLQLMFADNEGGGGNGGEALEYALFLANEMADEYIVRLEKFVVLVCGDQVPNGYRNTRNFGYDWKKEFSRLKRAGIPVYTVGVPGVEWDEVSERFFRFLAEETGGKFFMLKELKSLAPVMLGALALAVSRGKLSEHYLNGGQSLKKLDLPAKRLLLTAEKK